MLNNGKILNTTIILQLRRTIYRISQKNILSVYLCHNSQYNKYINLHFKIYHNVYLTLYIGSIISIISIKY